MTTMTYSESRPNTASTMSNLDNSFTIEELETTSQEATDRYDELRMVDVAIFPISKHTLMEYSINLRGDIGINGCGLKEELW